MTFTQLASQCSSETLGHIWPRSAGYATKHINRGWLVLHPPRSHATVRDRDQRLRDAGVRSLEDRARYALAGHIAERDWDRMIALTDRFGRTPENLVRRFQQKFIRRLAFDAKRKIMWFYVTEEPVRGHPHLHALLSGTRELSAQQIERAWTSGYSRITRYDPGGMGADYITKRINDDHCEWDFSKRLPPIRAERMLVGRKQADAPVRGGRPR